MFVLQSVDLFDMGLHDLIKPLIKKSVQAVIADSGKTSSNFMIPAHTRIKPLDAVGKDKFLKKKSVGFHLLERSSW